MRKRVASSGVAHFVLFNNSFIIERALFPSPVGYGVDSLLYCLRTCPKTRSNTRAASPATRPSPGTNRGDEVGWLSGWLVQAEASPLPTCAAFRRKSMTGSTNVRKSTAGARSAELAPANVVVCGVRNLQKSALLQVNPSEICLIAILESFRNL